METRWFTRIAWLAVALALIVIVFGAFVRLSHAGLSCPDWPTCYGRATWPVQSHEIDRANQAFPQRAVEVDKAWREQLHRHLAAGLGVLALALALLATRTRGFGWAVVLGASAVVAVSIVLYMGRHYEISAILAGAAEAALMAAAWRWRGSGMAALATVTLAVVVFQAMLGMWTVTWLLKPIVVVGHLLGGMATFALLGWMAWRTTAGALWQRPQAMRLRPLLGAALALLSIQIALGGWTSANYAALACGVDFPTCLGRWWPATDFGEAFVLWRGIGVDYEGGVLDLPSRTAIHLSHRLFAILVLGHLLVVSLRLVHTPGLARWGWALGLLVGAQVALGIGNVVYGLPLWMATAHNAGAALLVFVLVTLLARLRTASL
ncbi:MAG TPA: COX15/CtaA family protein [Xanthomonadaceae bacterium]|nr:COX15/CtaA family protein [Xanthomonadaceae bacterium]